MASYVELKEKLRAWIRTTFPERQLFLRSDGRVRFVKLAPWFQMSVAGGLLIALGYVATLSVQVVMRGDALAAKDRRIEEIRQNRDTLADDLMALKTDLIRRADELEQRQRYIDSVMTDQGLGADQRNEASQPAFQIPYRPDFNDDNAPRPAEDEEAALSSPEQTRNPGVLLASMNEPVAAVEPETAADQRLRLARQLTMPLVALHERLATMYDRQDAIAEKLVVLADRQLAQIDAILEPMALSTERVLGDSGAVLPSGGPFVPIVSEVDAIVASLPEESPFLSLYQRQTLLHAIGSSLNALPFGEPAADYYISSHFGIRRDPIRRVRAMHNGLDMAGWPGTAILAAGPGTVVKAGRWGSFGNMVEIDHGNGILTRYGHMKRVTVSRGQTVTRGDKIGLMGKTGRSTDTHLHYEVWVDGQPRNPVPFLKAARDVLQIQGRSDHE